MEFSNDEHVQLLQVLKYTTYENPLTSKRLRFKCAVDEPDTTGWPKTRRLVRETMEVKGIPIASNGFGHFIVRNEDELFRCLANLQRRVKGTRERVSILKAAWRKRKNEPRVIRRRRK